MSIQILKETLEAEIKRQQEIIDKENKRWFCFQPKVNWHQGYKSSLEHCVKLIDMDIDDLT